MHISEMDERYKPAKETTSKENPEKETLKKGKRLKAKSKKTKETYVDNPNELYLAELLSVESERLRLESVEREQRMMDEEIDDNLDDTLEAMKTKKMKDVADYAIKEPKIPTDAQLLLDFKKTCKDSLDSDQTLSVLDVVDEGDMDDAFNFTILVHEKMMVAKEKSTLILTTISSPRTQSSQDNISRYLNEDPAPSLKDEKPIGDSVNPDRLPKSQTVIVPNVTMTEPTGPDQRGSIGIDYVLITPDETITLEATPREYPKLTICTSVSHVLRTEQISLTSSPTTSSTNNTGSITGKRTSDDQDHPENHEGEKRHNKSRFAGQPSSRNDQDIPNSGDHETQPSAKIREYPRWLDGQTAEYTDYTWVTRSDKKDLFNEVVNTYPDPDEPEDEEIVLDNSSLTLAKRIKRCFKIDKLNLSKIEELGKDGYEMFRNRYMSKDDYEYNMDQMTISMSDDMD
nr:hypothetical protein [Tanacetum cinerariifolium]